MRERPKNKRRPKRKILGWFGAAAIIAALAAVGISILILHEAAHRPPVTTLPTSHGLDGASAVTVDGSHVWIASSTYNGNGAVTELDAHGRWLQTISSDRYGLRYPSGIAAAGTYIWVANDPQTGDGQTPKPGDGTMTQLNASNGSLVRTLTARRYQFDFPGSIATAGNDIWVVNAWGGSTGNGSLTELNASTGALVRTVSGPTINGPVDITVRGTDMWVLNSFSNDSGSVTKLDASTGRVIWTATGRKYGFTDPSAIAIDGNKLWVANEYAAGDGGSVTVLSASTGRWIKTLSGGCYGFYSPASIAISRGHVWVANSYIDASGGSLTELSADTGHWIQTLSSNDWLQSLSQASCRNGLSSGGYAFANPGLVAAVGARIWLFDGPISTLRA
jgi:hypothetical protein